MTTANQIIGQALGKLGIRTSGAPVKGDEAEMCLEALNTMLDAWRVQSLYAYATQKVAGTLPASTTSRTIGPAGQLVLDPRPFRIESGTYASGGIDYPIVSITQAEYERIGLKTAVSLGPDRMFYNPAVAAGTVFFWPLASASVTLSLVCLTQLSEFADLTTSYDLPPGYERALVFSLAEEIAADFEREIPPTVARIAGLARRTIGRANHQVPQLEVWRPHVGSYYDILAG